MPRRRVVSPVQALALALPLILAFSSWGPQPCLAQVQNNNFAYNPDVMVYSQLIGGPGGGAFDTTTCDSSSFELIKRIQVYSALDMINGITIETTNGIVKSFGTTSCNMKELVFEHTPDYVDTIQSLSLWDNCLGGISTRLGGIRITTKGKSLDVGMSCKDRCTEYTQNVASGIPCGIFGRSGMEIDSLGFSFLQRVAGVPALMIDSLSDRKETTGVVTLNGGANGFTTIDNRKGSVALTRTVNIATERTFTEALESSMTFKFNFGIELSFSQKLTVVGVSETQVGVKATTGFEITEVSRQTRTTTASIKLSVTTPYTCPAWNMCDFFDYTVEGSMTANYKGKLVYKFVNGKTKEYTDLGRYSVVRGSNQRTTVIMYCCGTATQCLGQNTNTEACNRPTGLPSMAAIFPANITILPMTGEEFEVQGAAVLPTDDFKSLSTAMVQDCTTSPDACSGVATSTRALLVQQGLPTVGSNVLGEISDTDLSRFVNRSLAAKSLVAFSLHGCNFGKNCVHEAPVKVLTIAKSLSCQPGAVLMTLQSQPRLGQGLIIPKTARASAIRLQVVGASTDADDCVLQLRTVTRQKSGASAASSATDVAGLEAVACTIGMAKCAAAGLNSSTSCCQSMPPAKVHAMAECNCVKGTVSCFPGDAAVLLEGGVQTTMDRLKIGDRVQVLTAEGQLRYQPVYLFGHKDAAARSTMLMLEAESRTSGETVKLTLSADHFVPVAGTGTNNGHVMTRARDVTVGDRMWAVSHGKQSTELFTVTSVTPKAAQGLFNPFTPAGTVVVNGVVASVHSAWFLDRFMDWIGATHLIPTVYQAILLPVYYVIYGLLGPEWVRTLDDAVDFAEMGTRNPVLTLFGVWSCVSAAVVPMLIVASKAKHAGSRA